ncbi:MAG: helix-turn-helix domain-containing protein [Gemmatimonadetes bacterium]|nr:helix-turn-helix domain-containing protein [Gemmatimonadota bacterium]
MSEEKQPTIAEELSAARQACGSDLEEVQQQTGISLSVLQSIEAGQLNVVEPVFVRLALKAYAEFLDLDPEPLLSRFDQQQRQVLRPRQRSAVLLEQPKPQRSSRTPLIVIGLVVGVCCLLAVAYYFFGDKIAAPPTAPAQSAAPTQIDTPAQTISPPTESRSAVALNDPLLVQSSTESEASEAPATADTSAIVATAQTAAALVVLELVARDSTWVQVRWDEAVENFEGTIAPGERRRFEARDHFVVLSTNPHGISYWLDGELLGGGQLGNPNQVLRFRATADGIQILGSNLQPLTEEAPDDQS